MTENREDPEEQEARDIEERLRDDDPQLHRFMSTSAVPWIITRAALGALITVGGLQCWPMGRALWA